MRWLVEVHNIEGDGRLLADVLADLDIELHCEDDGVYLTSDRFEALRSRPEIWTLANRLRDIIVEVSATIEEGSVGFEVGDLYEQKEDGSRSKHTFLSPMAGQYRINGHLAVVKVTGQGELSEDARKRLQAEEQERAYQKKRAIVSSRVTSAFQDERALKVHRLLQKDLTPHRMGQIMDLIQDDLGHKLLELASTRDLSRFYRSINHPDVFGDESRHITSKAEPPPKPMLSDEAKAFVRGVSDAWFKRKSGGENDA